MAETRPPDDLLARIDAAIEEAGREAKLDDPTAQRILDEVESALGRGDTALQLKPIAVSSGVSLQTVGRLFPSREQLIHGYLIRARLRHLGLMRSILVVDDGSDRVATVVTLFTAVFNEPVGITVGRRTIELWAEGCRSQDVRADFVLMQTFWADLVEILLEREIGNGVGPFTPRNVGALFTTLTDGFALSSALMPESRDKERAVTAALALWELVKTHCAAGQPTRAPMSTWATDSSPLTRE